MAYITYNSTPEPGPTDTCLMCVSKHLGQAAVLMDEARQGYPMHRWLAIGHMGEAARECCDKCPALAEKIRAYRHELQKNANFMVPFLALIQEAQGQGR